MTNVDTLRIKELDLELIQPSTKTFRDPEQGGSKTIVCGKPGCFKEGTPVLMYDGTIKPVEAVQVGELVMGPDSQPRTVLELCRNNEEMFTITPENGVPYTVNLGHKLVLANVNEPDKIVEMTVRDFIPHQADWKNNWRVLRTGIEFPFRVVNSDPYVIGKLYRHTSSPLPEEYRVNSKKVRLEVLAGIIDSEVGEEYCIDHITSDITFLARSLGFGVEVRNQKLFFTGAVETIPCRTERVKTLYSDPLRCRFQLVLVGIDNYYGFTITGDHRFLLGTFDIVRNTGKTTLIASLLYAKKHIFPVGMAMSGTEDSNHFYRSVMPSSFVFNNYEEKQVENFIKRQKIAREYLDYPWAVIILDDCTDDPAIFRKPLQNGMYKRGRHWKMWYILSLQYGMDVRPVIRTNVDGIFILREPNMRNRRVMYENYASIIPDFKLFCTILDQITDDYTALYIHNATKTNDWKDCVFWYKAKPVPSTFKFGCPEYWQHHEERYNPEYTDPVIV